MKYLLILSAILAATSAVELGSVHVGPGPGPAAPAPAQDTLAHDIEKRSSHFGGHGGRFHFNVKREATEGLGVLNPDPLTKEFIKNEGGDQTLEASSLAIQKRSVHYGGHGGRFHFNVKRSVENSLVSDTEATSSRNELPDVGNTLAANPKRVIVKRSKNYGGRGRFHFNAKRSVGVGNSLTKETEAASIGNDSLDGSNTETNPKRVIVKRSKNYGGRGRFHFNAKRSVISGKTNETEGAGTGNDSVVVSNTETNPKRVIVKRSKNYGGRGRFHFSLKRSVASGLSSEDDTMLV